MTGFSKLYLKQSTVLQFLLLLTRLFLSEQYEKDFLELVIQEEKQITWYFWNTFVESAAQKKTESVREFDLHWEVYIAWKTVPKIHKVSAAQHENLESNVQDIQFMEDVPDWVLLVC